MGLLSRFGSAGGSGNLKMPVKFKAKVDRKTPAQTVSFDVEVKGFFIGKAGKPDFVIEGITVIGIPNMDLSSFVSKEIDDLKKYALRVEYPRLLGMKAPE